VTSGQVTEEKVTPLMLFYGKFLNYRVYSLQGTSGKAETPNLPIFGGIKVHLKISKSALKVAAIVQCL
jgi:hypothetical protein